MLWGNLMKINQIYTSYKFAQSCCIPPYIKHEILAPKGSQTTCAMPGDYLTSWNCTLIGQWDQIKSQTFWINPTIGHWATETLSWQRLLQGSCVMVGCLLFVTGYKAIFESTNYIILFHTCFLLCSGIVPFQPICLSHTWLISTLLDSWDISP